MNPDSPQSSEVKFEIGHVLFIDIVGYSKLLIDEQSDQIQKLWQIVRGTEQFRIAEAEGKLLRLSTGDGGALVFRNSPDAPVLCAIEISKALRNYPELKVRMGIHSGPVNEITDLNEQANIAGAGINVAKRVMDCGDAGHILLSKRAAEDLEQYPQWRAQLHDLGQCEVKHGTRLQIVSLYTDKVGNPELPEQFKQSAKQASALIAKSTAKRFGWNWVIVGAAVVIVAVIIGFIALRLNRSPTVSIPEKSIAILPFKPLVAQDRDQVLEMGMADTLITKLSSSQRLIVRSLNSVRKYDGLNQDPVAAGHELRVTTVLEGNVERSGNHIRLTTRLINVADGASLWAETFDEKFTDVFALQDAISEKVAASLAVRLSGEEQKRLAQKDTDNIEAYQLFLTGRYHFAKVIPAELRASIGFFEQAIALDPGYAQAYYGLAEANRSLSITADVPSGECLPKAENAARKAIELDDGLAEAHASLGFCLCWYDWDWKAAQEEVERAITLNPNSAFARFVHAHILSDQGRHEEALAEITRVRQLDPVFLLFRALEGMFYFHAGRNQEAITALQSALALDQNFWITRLTLGKVYTQLGKYPEARAEFVRARELSHGNSEAIASLGYVAGLAGDTATAQQILVELLQLRNGQTHYVPPINIALIYNGMGDKTEALNWLSKAVDERDVRLTLLKVDPRWDSFRGEQGFIAVLKRVGLQ